MTSRAQQAPELFFPVRTENNYTELYIDGPDCLSMLLREIKKARHYINFQVMMFYPDEAGKKIADALAEKVKEGVVVRVMSDKRMSSVSRAIDGVNEEGSLQLADPEDFFTRTGIQFIPSDKESYWQHNWQEVRSKLCTKGVPEEFLLMQDAVQEGVTLNLNTIDHRKIMVFDGETAVVTSMNVGNKYLYEEQPAEVSAKKRGYLWHDGAMLIKGPCVSVLNKEFASKWMVRGGDVFDYTEHHRSKEKYGTDSCTVYSFFPGMQKNHLREYYLHKIEFCEGPLIIENPYINDEAFWEKLSGLSEEQAKKITLINPYKAKGNDFLQNESAIKCRMWAPFQKGVTFYSYQQRMTHLKIALDVQNNEVFFGSYNLNHRSALHDFEVNILVHSKKFTEQIQQQLQRDMAEATKITGIEEFYQHPYKHPGCFLLEATDYFE